MTETEDRPTGLDVQTYTEGVAAQVADAIFDSMVNSPRSQQAANHVLGVSDIGRCHEFVRRMIVQAPVTDQQVDVLPAFIGTAVGDHVEKVLRQRHENVRTQLEVETQLPSGLWVRGHPDIVLPNAVWDGKTEDGLSVRRRTGPDERQWWQPTLYLLGLHQAGELAVPLDEAWVAVIYIDRSGREKDILVYAERFDWARIEAIEAWLEDVIYAARTGETAQKDPPREFCRVACQWFSDCRALDTDVDGLITDPFALGAVDTLLLSKKMKREAEGMERSAKGVLDNVQGSTGSHFVRWIDVPGSEIKPGYRRPYRKLDISPIKGEQ